MKGGASFRPTERCLCVITMFRRAFVIPGGGVMYMLTYRKNTKELGCERPLVHVQRKYLFQTLLPFVYSSPFVFVLQPPIFAFCCHAGRPGRHWLGPHQCLPRELSGHGGGCSRAPLLVRIRVTAHMVKFAVVHRVQ
jgi:hypothetical protein